MTDVDFTSIFTCLYSVWIAFLASINFHMKLNNFYDLIIVLVKQCDIIFFGLFNVDCINFIQESGWSLFHFNLTGFGLRTDTALKTQQNMNPKTALSKAMNLMMLIKMKFKWKKLKGTSHCHNSPREDFIVKDT